MVTLISEESERAGAQKLDIVGMGMDGENAFHRCIIAADRLGRKLHVRLGLPFVPALG